MPQLVGRPHHHMHRSTDTQVAAQKALSHPQLSQQARPSSCRTLQLTVSQTQKHCRACWSGHSMHSMHRQALQRPQLL